MNALKPIRNPEIITKTISQETMLYTAEGELIHQLNPTARLIWELCDGEHTLQDMEQALRSTFSIAPEQDVIMDIRRTLDTFASQDLLQPATP